MMEKPVQGVAVPSGPPAPTTPTPPQAAPEAPPPAAATPPQVPPDVPPPASATPPQAAPDVPPPEPPTPPQAVAGVAPPEPPPPAAPKVVAGLGPQAPPPKVVVSRRPSEGHPVQSFSANAQRVPVSDPVKEYLTAVKTYEQQVGPNTIRGKMIVECLPTTPGATAAEQRISPLPGTGYASEMYVGPGRDYMHVPMGSGHGHPTGGGAPPSVQRSREDFREIALGHSVDFAKMAEMGPEVRRLLDMGSHIDQILDITNMPRAGRRPSGYAEPTGPITAESCRPPPPPAYGAPMGRCSAEACPRDPRLHVEQEPRMGGRPSYEGPNYARRPCSRETTVYGGENRPAKRSMSRASDLLERIRQDIEEHCAENMLEKVHGGAGSIDDGEPAVRIHSRRNSLQHDSRPPSRNVRRASYDDGGRSDRRAPSKPRRQRSRRLKKSSSSSSSSVDRPRSRRSKRSKDSKGKKSRRRSQKSSSSSSSSSSGSRCKSKPKGRSIEFVRRSTERVSSSSTGPEMEPGETPQRQQHANRSAEKGIVRTQSKTAGGTLCKYGVQKEPVEDEEAPKGPQGPQVASSGGSVYRYESYPSVHPH